MTFGARSSAATRGSLDAVLDCAWDAQEFTAAEAMERTGLTRSTIIEALDRLIRLGLLRELPNAREVGEYRKGRPSRRFELRRDAAVVVGVDAGYAHLTAVVADLRGAQLARVAAEARSGRDDSDQRRREIVQVVDDALAAAGVERTGVLAVCVGVPAAVDASGDSPPHRTGFWEGMNPGLRELFAPWVPLVRVENDGSLAAVAEGAVGAAAGSRDFVTLLAGERFGMGVVIGGHLLRGAHGAAGEAIALRWVAGVDSDRGLGSLVAEWARADAMADRIPPGHPLARTPHQELVASTILSLADAGDPWAQTLANRAVLVLTRIGLVLASMYDPNRIVVSGAAAAGLGRIIDEANRVLPDELHGPAPRIVASQLGSDVVVTGAVMAAVEAARRGALRLALDAGRGRLSGVASFAGGA